MMKLMINKEEVDPDNTFHKERRGRRIREVKMMMKRRKKASCYKKKALLWPIWIVMLGFKR